MRRMKPQGIGEGLVNGLSTLGISVLGAIGGIAHHPIQVFLEDGIAPVRIIGGVGKGVVGVVTKPLGSAAELIAQTGQGVLTGTGWSRLGLQKSSVVPGLVIDLQNSDAKFQWKLANSEVVKSLNATLHEEDQYISVTLVLCRSSLHVIGEEEDSIRNIFSINEIKFLAPSSDP